MSEDKESTFKVTDRRKFNPDGTPRDTEDNASASAATQVAEDAVAPEPGDSAASEFETDEQSPEGASSDNVVNFPGEPARKKEQPEPASAAPEPEEGDRAPSAQDSQRTATARGAERAYDQENRGKTSSLPPASFLGLINMLGVEAAMHLGLMEGPGGGGHTDLEAARHMIDMLGMIQQKTRGNLNAQEDLQLDNLLADLRMHFVALSRKQ
ncbi:MAG TPA: DUF1844 domain-containing protein [Blastocatellia bacterium]|nr:DUF1844 domain-containing protein [Blastocatellia bacterium]